MRLLFTLHLMLVSLTVAYAIEGPLTYTDTNIYPLLWLDLFEAPAIVAEKLAKETVKKPEPGPLKFAEPYDVQLKTDTFGTWEKLPDGRRLWRLVVEAPGATDLNFGFAKYWMPPGGQLYILSADTHYFQGPYTDAHNKEHGQLWTPVVPGSRAVLECTIPPDAPEPDLELVHIGRGFLDYFSTVKNGATPKQGSCNNDVVCAVGDPWRDEIRSVARYTISGSGLCTGTLIMDAQGSFRNFFLSAYHCGVSSANAATLVIYWNYESANCGDLSGGSLADNQSGASFRASRQDVDMLLVELDDDPDPDFGVHYAGWDRSGIAPTGSVGIHHPNGDEKAISFNTNILTTMDNCITAGVDTHWRVDDWEDGTTEPGSSGSGIWDPVAHRVVGFLSGGAATCPDNNGYDCYGKLSVAWDGPSASTRLKDWLDPQDTGTNAVDGFDPPPVQLLKTIYKGHDSGASAPGDAQLYATNGAAITYIFTVKNNSTSALQNVYILDAALQYSNSIGNIAAGVSVTNYVEVFCSGDLVNTAQVAALLGGAPVTGYSVAELYAMLAPPNILYPQGGEVFSASSDIFLLWSNLYHLAATTIDYTHLASGDTGTFLDDMEDGTNGWTVSHDSGVRDWAQTATAAYSPAMSWFAEDYATLSDQYLVSPSILLPIDSELSFWHRYTMEEGFDGGVIEISTNNGVTWSDLGPLITKNGYTNTISTDYSSPISGQNAYSGSSGGFIQTLIDLSSYAGRTIQLRFRQANDISVGSVGWWVDNVYINPLYQTWSNAVNTAAGVFKTQWTTPAIPGTNYAVRMRSSAFGFTTSVWVQSAVFSITNTASVPDRDGDGLSDFWEIQHYSSPTSAAAMQDDDGDDQLNIWEYTAGTDPTNNLSLFQIVALRFTNGVEILQWDSISGKVYTVEYTSNSQASAWQILSGASNLPAIPPQNVLTNVSPSAVFRQYRIRVHP